MALKKKNLECMPKSLCIQLLSCLTLCDPMEGSQLGSSVHGIFQARILEWVASSFFRESSQPRDQIHISCTGRWILYHWATWEAYLKVELLNYRICLSIFWPFPLGRDYLCLWPVSGIFNILLTLRLVFSLLFFNWGIVYVQYHLRKEYSIMIQNFYGFYSI